MLAIAVSLLGAGCTGESAEAEAEREPTASTRSLGRSSPPPTTTVARVLPPTDVVATPDGLEVVITWTPSPSEVDRYLVYRDGRQVGSVPGSESEFLNEGDLEPETAYLFEVEATGEGGSADRIPVSVETPRLGLGAARVEGFFDVKGRTVSQSGFQRFADRPQYGWRFRPRCPRDACNVRWSDLQTPRMRATLKRHGARYTGTYSGLWNGVCAGAPTTATVTLTLRVAAAEMDDGVWRATRLRGTLEQSSPAQLGCVSSRATVAVRVRLVN